uniref:Ig-like domain-containing protein n=1 Tax=Sus scrofa TaxID=9823 RepID=A0ABB5UPK9_PIG
MEDLSCCPVLCRLTPLLLLIQLLTGGSLEEFSVLGPSDPIVAVLGGDAVLSCRVFPAMNAEDMELRWFRSKFSEAVFIYQNRQEQKEEQLAGYAGRASLVRDFLSQGEAAVRIGQVQVSDNGLYTCFFRKGVFYEEASLELKVAGWASATAYGGSQAGGGIGAVAAGLRHSHSHVGSEPCLRPTPQLTATLNP